MESTQAVPTPTSPSNNEATPGMWLRYLKIRERIDGGSFGEVIKVVSIFDTKQYALKSICIGQFLKLTKPSETADSYELFKKLIREVLVMARLPEHPNIVQYLDAWFEGPHQHTFTGWLINPDSAPRNATNPPIIPSEAENNTFMYIKMELLDTNLNHWLQLNPHEIRDLEICKTITKQILCGLASIHGRQIVHRDLNPNNILLNLRGGDIMVKIGDFGLSREMTPIDTSLTRKVGGPMYSSPEMDLGDKYDFKTDIFSVGLVVLVLLHRFNTTKQLENTFDNVRRGEHAIINDIEAVRGTSFRLLRTMLDRKPERRPNSQKAFDMLNN